MKALIYVALIVVIVWGSFTWENAHAPAPVAQIPEEETASTTPEIVAWTPAPEVDIRIAEEKPSVAAGESATAEVVAEPSPIREVYTEEFVEALELAIHNRINDERVGQGLKTLAYDALLAEVAASHSTDMAKEDYFAHEDENDCDSSCRVTSAGYKWRMVGENLFLLKRSEPFSVDGASAIVVSGWMGSPGHRKNLFEEDFTYEGIGAVIKGDSIYVTEVLARPR